MLFYNGLHNNDDDEKGNDDYDCVNEVANEVSSGSGRFQSHELFTLHITNVHISHMFTYHTCTVQMSQGILVCVIAFVILVDTKQHGTLWNRGGWVKPIVWSDGNILDRIRINILQ